MTNAKILVGDAVERLRELPDGSVRTCVTSPPYWGLRDYGNDGQLGLEATPQEFVENLCQVFDEVWRVLADDGTLWVNLGDSYAGSGKGGQSAQKRSANWQPEYANKGLVPDGLKAKDLVGIPWRFAFAMQDRGWYLRQDIIWAKPNPMPESVTDRCTKSHEYIFLLTKNPRYYFDHEAIRERGAMTRGDSAGSAQRDTAETHGVGGGNSGINAAKEKLAKEIQEKGYSTRNKRSVWTVTTRNFKGAHFAVYPAQLIEPCVLAGSAEGDTVLDPFSGSGTTGEVALTNGRNYVGVELNPEYAALSEKRITNAIGMLGSVEVC
jgi:DNA modification methylase